VLANRLSENPRNRVLLLEAGGPDNWIWFHIPVGYLFALGNPRADWCLSTRPEPGLNGRSLAYPRGKALGGSSAINGMIYMRGQAADYDHWRQLGLTGWGWDDVLPVFKKHEDYYKGADEFHGTGGEWRVEAPRLRWPILDVYMQAATETGIPTTDDFNRGDNEGVAYFKVNQKRGRRWSAARGFLRPALKRHNLRVVTGCIVDKLVIENGRAKSVIWRHGREAHTAAARGEIILASGAIGSVQILQRSGIGRPDWLHDSGIEVRHVPRGRRREPAGPSAAAPHLQGPRHAHPERNVRKPVAARLDGGAVRLRPARADDRGALPARRVRPLRPRPRARRPAVPHPAFVARPLRRAAAPVSGPDVERVQSAADEPRLGARARPPTRTRRPRSRPIISPPTTTA
jgi:hypothetical protein